MWGCVICIICKISIDTMYEFPRELPAANSNSCVRKLERLAKKHSIEKPILINFVLSINILTEIVPVQVLSRSLCLCLL